MSAYPSAVRNNDGYRRSYIKLFQETDCEFVKPRIPRPVCVAARRTARRPRIARDQWALLMLDWLTMRKMECWTRWESEADGGGGRTRP